MNPAPTPLSPPLPRRAALWMARGLFLWLALFGLWQQTARGERSTAFLGPATPNPGPAYLIENISYPDGLDRIGAVEGREADTPVRVRLTREGRPVAEREIWFRLVDAPSREADDRLLAWRVALTGPDGIAATRLFADAGEGEYLVEASLEGDWSLANPVSIRVQARERLWVLTLLVGLSGGLALFLFGMDWAGRNLQKVAGDRFRSLLQRLTRTPLLGALSGVVSTFLLQSSSATTVMLVGLVGATLMTLTQAVGVIIGAKIGTTLTVQIIAFDISRYALGIIAAGLLLRMASRAERSRLMGKVVMGFGFIFFGMALMNTALSPLRSMPTFVRLLEHLVDYPLAAVLVSLVFTALVQSSAATIGVALALAAQGLLTLEAGITIGMGASIGTCATALLASFSSNRAGKQVAVAHSLYALGASLLFLPFVPQLADLTRLVSEFLGDRELPRQIANGFTLFALGAGFVALPLSGLLARLTRRLVPLGETDDEVFGPKYLQLSSIPYPAVAIEQALREVLHMGELVRRQLVGVTELVIEPDARKIYVLADQDDRIDVLERSIRPFLTRVAQRQLDSHLAQRERALVYIADALESIGDVIARSLLHALEKLALRDLHFSDEGKNELLQGLETTLTRLERVLMALENENHPLAQELVAEHEQTEWQERKSRAAHLERLHSGQEASLESSEAHLSIVGALLTINRRITDVARILRDELPR